MNRLKKAIAHGLFAWTLLSEILGPGIGPGVSKDFKELRPEEGSAYRYEQRTSQEYERAESERNRERRKNDALFENFYLREAASRKSTFQ